MRHLTRVLERLFAIVTADAEGAARWLRQSDYEQLARTVASVVQSMQSRPVPATYLYAFKTFQLKMADAMMRLRKLSVALNEYVRLCDAWPLSACCSFLLALSCSVASSHENALAAYLERETQRLATCRDVTSFTGEVVQQATASHNFGQLVPFLKQHLSACDSLRAECEGLAHDARVAQVTELAARVTRVLFVVEALDPDVDMMKMSKSRNVVLNLGRVLPVAIRLVLETLDAERAIAVVRQVYDVLSQINATAPHVRRAFVKYDCVCCGNGQTLACVVVEAKTNALS